MAAALALTGCFGLEGYIPGVSVGDPNDVMGTYEANWHAGRGEYLWLRPDSTYAYLFIDSAGGEYRFQDSFSVVVLRDSSHVRVHLSRFQVPYRTDFGCYEGRRGDSVELPTGEVMSADRRRNLSLAVYRKDRTGTVLLVTCALYGEWYERTSTGPPKTREHPHDGP